MPFRPTRLAITSIVAALLVAIPAGSAISASLNVPSSVTLDLPGVAATQALEVCTQDDGRAASCRTVLTPDIQKGQIVVGWNNRAGAHVAATPTTPFPPQCAGRAGSAIRAYVGGVATDINMAVKAYYAGVSTPDTIVSSRRSVDPGKGTTIWACLL